MQNYLCRFRPAWEISSDEKLQNHLFEHPEPVQFSPKKFVIGVYLQKTRINPVINTLIFLLDSSFWRKKN